MVVVNSHLSHHSDWNDELIKNIFYKIQAGLNSISASHLENITVNMDIHDDHNDESTDQPMQTHEHSDGEFKAKTNEELNEKNPARLKRKQATQEQLNNPLHGVKLAQILERLVDHYGWEYLADRVNIRCFMYNPTMKSSVRFLRRMPWAREHVEDIYLEMLEDR